MAKKKKKTPDNVIAQNKRARFDYQLSEYTEAGMCLMGWEVKSLREGRVQIVDTFVQFKNGEAWVHNAKIEPLISASTHFVTEPTRPRKLLLHNKEIAKFQQAIDQKGYTAVLTQLYWKGHLVKGTIALAKGKKDYDKREAEKERDWNRQKQRLMSHSQR